MAGHRNILMLMEILKHKPNSKQRENYRAMRIPTIDDLIAAKNKVFFHEFEDSTGTAIEIDDVKVLMKDFAELHVIAALKAASIKAHAEGDCPECACGIVLPVNKESILNAYPLSNIK